MLEQQSLFTETIQMNKELLIKGIKRAFLGIPFMFLGPILIHNAFMNQHTWIHYLVLGAGILICLLGVFFLFNGIRIMMQGLFNDQN